MKGTDGTRFRKALSGFLSTGLAVALSLAACPSPAWAEHLTGSSDWQVTHTEGGRLEDNYSEGDMEADVRSMQPGDDLTVSVRLRQEAGADSDWYVSNEVLKSLEAGDAEGSGYGYALSYEAPDGQRTELYRSESVGGTGSQGLAEATKALGDYIYLGTLSDGQEGRVVLSVLLDGETEQNAYADKFARIRLKFAVEDAGSATSSTAGDGAKGDAGGKHDLVKTGEETNLLPLYVAMAVSGIGLLGFLAYDTTRRRARR